MSTIEIADLVDFSGGVDEVAQGHQDPAHPAWTVNEFLTPGDKRPDKLLHPRDAPTAVGCKC